MTESTASTAKKAGIAALITALIPALGYAAHVYQSYLSAEELQAEVELEQRKYDLQIQEARNQDLKEYVPALLSDQDDERALAVAMLTVLHPEEAPQIFSAVSKATEPEQEETAFEEYDDLGEEASEVPLAVNLAIPEEGLDLEPAPAPVAVPPPVRKSPPQQKEVSAYLEQRAEVVRELPKIEWFVVLASGPATQVEDLKAETTVSGVRIVEGGGTHYLIQGPYPNRDAAQRAMISIRPRVPGLSPFLSQSLW